MKWTYLLTVLLAQALAQEKLPTHEHHDDDETEVYEDSCTAISEDSECANNPAINGICKERCTEVNEIVASASNLCPRSCVCCTTSRSRCSKVYNEGFCSAGQCEDGLIEIMDTSLCSSGYVCCRQPPKGGTFREFEGAGERGIGPHFQTFDGLKFTYGGLCKYVLVKEKTDNPSFSVASRHVPASNLDNALTAFHSSLEVTRNENTITLSEGNDKIQFNGIEIQDNLPYETTDHSIIVDWSDNQKTVTVSIEGILFIEYNGKGKTSIHLDKSLAGKVWGLLGNANGNRKDDLTYKLSDGVENTIELRPGEGFVKEDLQRFFNGWLVTCSSK